MGSNPSCCKCLKRPLPLMQQTFSHFVKQICKLNDQNRERIFEQCWKKLQYWHGLASLTPINGRSYGFIGSTLDPNSMPKSVVLTCLLHSCMVLWSWCLPLVLHHNAFNNVDQPSPLSCELVSCHVHALSPRASNTRTSKSRQRVIKIVANKVVS